MVSPHALPAQEGSEKITASAFVIIWRDFFGFIKIRISRSP
jgi:hypothetical protein